MPPKSLFPFTLRVLITFQDQKSLGFPQMLSFLLLAFQFSFSFLIAQFFHNTVGYILMWLTILPAASFEISLFSFFM
jgi:hypothetical protein